MIDQDSCYPPQIHMLRFLHVHTGKKGRILKDMPRSLKLALQSRHSDPTGEGVGSAILNAGAICCIVQAALKNFGP